MTFASRREEVAVVQARLLDPGVSFTACLGAVLRRLRALRGLTQAGLGGLAGYDGSYVGAVERAAVRPSRELVERCDRALDAGGGLLALWQLADREWTSPTTSGAGLRPAPGDLAMAAGAVPDHRDLAGLAGDGPGGGFGLQAAAPAPADPVSEAMELARRAEACDVDPGTLAGVERAVERLRQAASATPPAALFPAARAQLGYVGRLLEGRLTLGPRRRLLATAGWLSLLLAQLHFDTGELEAAEANRDAALRLADQAGQAELAAWTFEALAWWALVGGRHREAVDLARAGQDRAPPASAAAVQLALDEAQALTHLGDHRQAAGARRQAALTKAMLPAGGWPGSVAPGLAGPAVADAPGSAVV